MLRSMRAFADWLGAGRTQFIVMLLALTGLASLILNAVGQQQVWVRLVQSLLLIVFLFGASATIILRFDPHMRRQALYVVGPAILALALGLIAPIQNAMLFALPIALGWMGLALLSMRGRVRREYQAAIRHMRHGEYKEAINVMSELVREEPDVPDHYRFRAELYRLSNRLKKAREDYQQVVRLLPNSGVGYNGMAEVHLQDGEYDAALPFAQKALELEPNEWVPAYNLGMIEDRRKHWANVEAPLQQAVAAGIPDSRHRLLAYLWIARALVNQGRLADAEEAVSKLQRERNGLKEWETIFQSEEAAVLKNVLLADVELAKQLADGKLAVSALAETPSAERK